MSNLRHIAILGATSQIARSLIIEFLTSGPSGYCLHLFSRSEKRILSFLRREEFFDCNCRVYEGYRSFPCNYFDVIINCVGTGTVANMKERYHQWFTVTELFDNLCIDYLASHKESLYISLSSGAVYGTHTQAMQKSFCNKIAVNSTSVSDFYSIARINAEAKHRSYNELRIVDLRIFSFFSRFINLHDGYFMSDLVFALLNELRFKTSSVDMVRDFLHPQDLFRAIMIALEGRLENQAYDLYSKSPVRKMEILECCRKEYGLNYCFSGDGSVASGTGEKNIYCSGWEELGKHGYVPQFDSLSTIRDGLNLLLT